jgi:uncharacterized membrane protein
MPNIGSWHPYVVHVVIGFLIAGVLLRLLWVPRKWSWTGHSAAVLIVAGALAAVVAVRSGTDAHGPAERVPGARDAVVEHEEWGERTRNFFLVVAALELLALAVPSRQRFLRYGAAALGAVGLFFIYETGEHGGALVYEYAGGVGLRTGDPEDVQRLLLAGLYHQSVQDRREGKPEAAAALIDEMARRFPSDPDVRVLRIESLIRDRETPGAALALLDSTSVPDNPRLRRSLALMRANALIAAGQLDSARAVLTVLVRDNPANQRYKTLLDSISK